MDAIVLARNPHREYDEIISLVTQEQGKQEFLIRGVKKIASKNAPHLEPCSIVDITIAEGKELPILTKAVSIEYFKSIREDIKKNLIASYIATITHELLRTGDDDARIFIFLKKFLTRISDTDYPSFILIDTYIARLLGYMGFIPELRECVVSGHTAPLTHFSAAAGGMLAAEVAKEKLHVKEKIIAVSEEARQYLLALWEEDWDHIARIPTEHQITIHNIIYEFLRYHTERSCFDWFRYAKLCDSI